MTTTQDSGRTQRFSHIFARLQELQNYGWDPAIEPFHSVRDPYLPGPRLPRLTQPVVRQLPFLWLRKDCAQAGTPAIEGTKHRSLPHPVAFTRLCHPKPADCDAHPPQLRLRCERPNTPHQYHSQGRGARRPTGRMPCLGTDSATGARVPARQTRRQGIRSRMPALCSPYRVRPPLHQSW